MEVPSEIVAGNLLQDYGDIAELAARAGGDVLRDWRGRFAVSTKGPRDLVTEADVASQKTIREILLSRFPDHGFIGEEGDQDLIRSMEQAIMFTDFQRIVSPWPSLIGMKF